MPVVRRAGAWSVLGLLAPIALCLMMVGCGGSSATATSQSASPVAPGPIATVTLESAKTCEATPAAGVSSSSAIVGGNLYFVHSAGEARKLSRVPVVTPKRLPAGLVIQGYEIPLGGGYPSPTPKPLAIVTIDITRTCDLRSPTLIRLEESTTKQTMSTDRGTVKKLNLDGKQVTWTSSERYDGYDWQNNGMWFSLTVVSKGTVPLPQAEAIIAAWPRS